MKKKILIAAIAIVAISAMLAFAINNTSSVKNAKKVSNENVSLVMYKSYDYSQSLYNGVLAKIDVQIEKVNRKGEETVLWEKTFDPKFLNQYPSIQEAIRQNVTVTTANAKGDSLFVRYKVTYNTNGNQLEIPRAVKISDLSQIIAIII